MVTAPSTLSPSKASTFTQCPRRYRYTAIEGLVEPPTPATVTGTIVHAALEHLFVEHPRGTRGRAQLEATTATALATAIDEGEVEAAGIAPHQLDALGTKVRAIGEGYLKLEDPNDPVAVATELFVDTHLAHTHLRGIVDRLDLRRDGTFAIVDYKTGRTPGPAYEKKAFEAMRIYAMLLEPLLPAPVSVLRLYYLSSSTILEEESSPARNGAVRRRTEALWDAIEHSCAADAFPPRPGPLCRFCHFAAHCPGDPPSTRAGMDPAP